MLRALFRPNPPRPMQEALDVAEERLAQIALWMDPYDLHKAIEDATMEPGGEFPENYWEAIERMESSPVQTLRVLGAPQDMAIVQVARIFDRLLAGTWATQTDSYESLMALVTIDPSQAVRVAQALARAVLLPDVPPASRDRCQRALDLAGWRGTLQGLGADREILDVTRALDARPMAVETIVLVARLRPEFPTDALVDVLDRIVDVETALGRVGTLFAAMYDALPTFHSVEGMVRRTLTENA